MLALKAHIGDSKKKKNPTKKVTSCKDRTRAFCHSGLKLFCLSELGHCLLRAKVPSQHKKTRQETLSPASTVVDKNDSEGTDVSCYDGTL